MSQEAGFVINSSYFLSVAVLTGVLIWGLKHVSRELGRVDPASGQTFMAKALSEKRASGTGGAASIGPEELPSFSRVAGALGAVGLASTFVAIGYWALYELYFGDDLCKISNLSTYFLAGSALFIPYAFNSISSIFKQP